MALKTFLQNLKALSKKEFRAEITRENELYKSILQYISGEGMFLDRDLSTDDYVKKGYEGNADVFSIATKIAAKFGMAPGKLQVKRKNKWEDVDSHEFLDVIQRPNHYQTWFEFKMAWELFRLITGNSIVYCPKLENGNDKGKLTTNGLLMMPTQLVEIRSGGWSQPIGEYTFTINEAEKGISPENVWHERFPSLQYEHGRNFMGLSPLKAAVRIINMQNGGYDRAAKMYNQGMPPFLISDENLVTQPTKEQKEQFENVWRNKYKDDRNVNIPALMGSGVQIHQLGYKSVKELGILENVQDGRRVFCNVLQVAAELFNDSVGSTFNNRSEARKEMWTDRIMVDLRAFHEGITNNILPGYAGKETMRYIPDYSEIEELQEDKAKKSTWVSKMYNDSVISGNEYRELLGVSPLEEEHLNRKYIAMNRIPVDQIDSEVFDVTEEEKAFYQKNEITY